MADSTFTRLVVKDPATNNAVQDIYNKLNQLQALINGIQSSSSGSFVPTTRQVGTTPPLEGGGSLAQNLSLTIDVATASKVGVVKPDNTSVTVTSDGTLSASSSSGVTAVTGTAPISSSGGTTPDISVSDATSSSVGVVKPDNTTITVGAGGVLSAVGSGSVTSVGLTAPAEFTVSGSPVTTSGTLAIAKSNESANTVWAGPTSGGSAQPAFRALVSADLPGGTGTVTSVGLTMPAEFSVSGTPITGSGTLTVTKATESANQVYAGPTSGVAAAPTFRALVLGDLPSTVSTLQKYTTSWTSLTSVTVTHNLNTVVLLWAVFDSTGNITDGPETFSSGGVNSFTITFGAAFTGSIVVIG